MIKATRSKLQNPSKNFWGNESEPIFQQLKTGDAVNNQIDLSEKRSNWSLKERLASWLSKKQSRFETLYLTTLDIKKNQGYTAAGRRIYRFFKGERINSKITSVELLKKTKSREISDSNELYTQWLRENEPRQTVIDLQRTAARSFAYRPLISILTQALDADKKTLEKTISTVLAQTYTNWELCLVVHRSAKPDILKAIVKYTQKDKRIKIRYMDSGSSVSSNLNAALEMAAGEFIALLNDQDELSPDALYENVLLLNKEPEADMIYSDEDALGLQGSRCEPFFKPDWSPDFFYSSMYTGNLGIYRKKIVDRIKGFRAEHEGAEIYDLVLRLSEQTDRIFHIPKILYHRRQTQSSGTSRRVAENHAKIKAVAEHLERLNIEAEVMPGLSADLIRVKRKLSAQPKISIIIPTRDKSDYLKKCVISIQKLSTYRNYELIIIDNNSSEPEALKYLEELSKDSDIQVLKYDRPFNFAAINNLGAKHANGQLLLFLNNDTEVISADWLEAMVEHAMRPEVGAVGARLLFADGMVQHAGVIIGIGGIAAHSHKHLSRDDLGYFGRAKAIQNLSAVTGACMMVKKEVFQSSGGFDEKNLAVAYNDIDLCLRLRQKKLLVVYTPYAELYHHESATRGSEQASENSTRFQRESEYMLNCWKEKLRSDPYYNPNLTLEKDNFSISVEAEKLNSGR